MLGRYDAYHWHTQRVEDGNDVEAITKAIEAAKAETGKPSIIAVRSVIGYGARKGSGNSEGARLAAGSGGDESELGDRLARVYGAGRRAGALP